ncbi:MAG: VOC family protein, partial [Myxococcales bacterium]|nr:VOC family protein [Myxococcales bacterium]
MVGYVTLGTNDPERGYAFYDALLEPLGAKRLMQIESFVLWGSGLDQAGLALTKAYDGKPATVGNGVMVAMQMDNEAQVK